MTLSTHVESVRVANAWVLNTADVHTVRVRARWDSAMVLAI